MTDIDAIQNLINDGEQLSDFATFDKGKLAVWKIQGKRTLEARYDIEVANEFGRMLGAGGVIRTGVSPAENYATLYQSQVKRAVEYLKALSSTELVKPADKDLSLPDRTTQLRTALQKKINEIDELEKTQDRDKCRTFYASAARLLEVVEGKDSHEVVEFRSLDGYSAVHGGDEYKNAEWDNESYYSHLKRARSILSAVAESLEWQDLSSPTPVNTSPSGITIHNSFAPTNSINIEVSIANLAQAIQQMPELTLEQKAEGYVKAEELSAELKKPHPSWSVIKNIFTWALSLGRAVFLAFIQAYLQHIYSNNGK